MYKLLITHRNGKLYKNLRTGGFFIALTNGQTYTSIDYDEALFICLTTLEAFDSPLFMGNVLTNDDFM